MKLYNFKSTLTLATNAMPCHAIKQMAAFVSHLTLVLFLHKASIEKANKYIYVDIQNMNYLF